MAPDKTTAREESDRGLCCGCGAMFGQCIIAPKSMAIFRQGTPFPERFGKVNRSSAIFYFRKGVGFETILTALDYWKIKRGIVVSATAKIRGLDGNLIVEIPIAFPESGVWELSEKLPLGEGSVEFEVKSREDLVIPYAAVVAFYKAPRSTCLVHSYARAYSEEERAPVEEGEETGWTVRDEAGRRSFAVFHNGALTQEANPFSVTLINSWGERHRFSGHLPPLAPFATWILHPSTLFPQWIPFLRGKPGSALLSFTLRGSFPRLLVGNEDSKRGEFAATHSNFNYSVHETDFIENDTAGAVMPLPELRNVPLTVQIYPGAARGNYEVEGAGQPPQRFCETDWLPIAVDPTRGPLKFRALNARLPRRIVMGLELASSKPALPQECSLGVFHSAYPAKHFHWIPALAGSDVRSRLIVIPSDAFGASSEAMIEMTLYGYGNPPVKIQLQSIRYLKSGVDLRELFELPKAHAGPLWITIRSLHPQLAVFILVESKHGSRCLEHSF